MFQIRRQRYLLARVRKEQEMMRQPDINKFRKPLSPAMAKETRRENKHDRSFTKAGAMTEGLSGRGSHYTEKQVLSDGASKQGRDMEERACLLLYDIFLEPSIGQTLLEAIEQGS